MTDADLFEKARRVMFENMIRGELDGGLEFHYTKPSPGTYPYQFFWDTCFHVFILSALGENDMAKTHLESLFARQESDGFVGHMIYWDRLKPGRFTDFFQSKPRISNFYKSHMSALIQPPLIAQAVERVYRNSGDKAFLRKMLPKVKKFFHWLATNRDFTGDGLLTIISTFESGMDWKPTYDVVVGSKQQQADWRLFAKVVSVDLRNFLLNYNLKNIYEKNYFLVKDVGFNTIYIQNLHSLAYLCEEVNDPEGSHFSDLAKRTTQSLLDLCYHQDDAAFYDVYGKENKKIKILTPTVFYPVVIKEIPESITDQVMERHFFNEHEFGTTYPIPSVAKNEPSFNPSQSMYIWRGPTWIVHNWFMHQFLMERGYNVESRKMIDSIRQLIEKSGFREYYNPFTGEGYGAHDFTWSGLIVDMINMERSHA